MIPAIITLISVEQNERKNICENVHYPFLSSICQVIVAVILIYVTRI